MIAEEDLVLAPIETLREIRGVPFPDAHKFRQFLITGPPGSGKTTLVGKIRGWPYEGYIDLAFPNWWRAQALTFRPREVHLGAPFKGWRETLTALDDEFLENYQSIEMDYRRILIPPAKKWVLGVDWRSRFVFDFILPKADAVYRARIERAKSGLFPHDRNITPEIVSVQIAYYRSIAWYFWKSGLQTYVRLEREGAPMRIVKCKKPPVT